MLKQSESTCLHDGSNVLSSHAGDGSNGDSLSNWETETGSSSDIACERQFGNISVLVSAPYSRTASTQVEYLFEVKAKGQY